MALIFIPSRSIGADYSHLGNNGTVIDVFDTPQGIHGEGAGAQNFVDLAMDKVRDAIETHKGEEVFMVLTGDYTHIAATAAAIADACDGELKLLKFSKRIGFDGGYMRVSFNVYGK